MAGYTILGQVNKVSMTLSISYQGIEKGLNPDGTKFNVFEITSSEVLNRTLSKVNVPGLTVDALQRPALNIYALSPITSMRKSRMPSLKAKTIPTYRTNFQSAIQQNKLAPNHTRGVAECAFLRAIKKSLWKNIRIKALY